ncbi:extracellular solute-binding protein [Ornithinibacillus bavariensis]|uniref:Sugar ABC transporter substrate-binding protein n=1 Tax=Ornithinibacillus bavariensis TaxID=545502 RepID=A0A920C5U0_9BACI|nr:extracellular solute-binding protein [Ornithinibacillus bavariensis]GIO27085.1 sugar ABC transporter substrate-binding protein [Ornithinibacillus bavariensis]
MKFKKLLLFMMIFIVGIVLVACKSDEAANNTDNGSSKVNETGMPIVDEDLELKIFANKPAQNEDNDWNDILIWNHYRDQTNINVKWNLINPDALQEKRNLALGGGDLPDAFFLAQIPNTDLLRYGAQGTLLPLNDLIDKYAPNLTKLMGNDPSIRSAITFPDGNIYSMPSLIEEDFLSLRLSARPWINEDWLKELNMDIPETTGDFYEYLKAVKELDPAGGGKTIPYGGTTIVELIQWLAGSFGVMNHGPSNANIDLDPSDNSSIRYYATTDEYKQLLEYIHQLYKEGLIDQSIFTIEWGQFLANASENLYGSMIFYDPIELFGEEIGSQYNSLAALEGPEGHKSYNKLSSSVWDPANLVLTNKNPNPAATVRWMDYFYSDEGAQLYYMGVENETFEVKDGKAVYMDHILNPEGDMTFEQAIAKQLTWLGSINGIIKADFFQGGESAPQSMAAAEKIEPFVPEEIWPRFTFTEEENKVLQSVGQDVTKYVEEMRDKFITGDADFSEWDNYVETVKKNGLEDVVKVYQDAYDRYKDNQ